MWRRKFPCSLPSDCRGKDVNRNTETTRPKPPLLPSGQFLTKLVEAHSTEIECITVECPQVKIRTMAGLCVGPGFEPDTFPYFVRDGLAGHAEVAVDL